MCAQAFLEKVGGKVIEGALQGLTPGWLFYMIHVTLGRVLMSHVI